MPTLFRNKFLKHTHKFPTIFSESNYNIPSFKLSKSHSRISIRIAILWKCIPKNSEKMKESVSAFQSYMKINLLELEHERTFEWNCVKRSNTSCSSSKLLLEELVLKRSGFLGERLWWRMIFVNIQGNGLRLFLSAPPGATVFEGIYGRLLLEHILTSWACW